MKVRWPVVKRILWPERASLFVVIGGAAGLIGDMGSFFTEIISPLFLVILFSSLAFVSSLLCLQRAALADPQSNEEIDDVVQCGVCDAMRFGLFAAAAFLILFTIGQGQSATEVIGEKLGLIHEDVKQIGTDVASIKEDVRDIGDVMQAQKIIAQPRTVQDFFTNAFIYSNMQRDAQSAMDALEKMYEAGAPRKMDAAELYYTVGRQIYGRDELLERMASIGTSQKDATLLVIAGRNEPDAQKSDALYEQAKAIDPDLPFAYWDIMKFSSEVNSAGIQPEEQAAMLRKQIDGIENFIEKISAHPAGYYFYLPQYQADHEMVAQQTLSSLQRTVKSYDDMEVRRQENERKIQEMRSKKY